MEQKRYTTWGTPHFPMIETRELGHADTLEDARDIAAGCDIAFVYDHEVGHNVDSMVSADYKRRIGGVWIDDYSGWQSQKPIETAVCPERSPSNPRRLSLWRKLLEALT